MLTRGVTRADGLATLKLDAGCEEALDARPTPRWRPDRPLVGAVRVYTRFASQHGRFALLRTCYTRAARIQTNVTTEIEERRIDAADLRVGMYICRLDRPWEGTPFPLQGFEVRDEDDIRTVREWSRHVYIDALRDLCA